VKGYSLWFATSTTPWLDSSTNFWGKPLRKSSLPISPQIGGWRRLSRRYEGSEASARARLEVASLGELA
jgi:hypothetical protein